MKNFDSAEDLIAYLPGLIDDLRESGNDATADDFEDCLECLEALTFWKS